jgi:DNA-binding CsgD family transcriptional regulator
MKLMELTQRAPLSCDRPQASECDRCILNLLRPQLAQAEENKLEGSQIQQLLLQFKQVVEQGGVICLTIDGQVQFMTPSAEHLLREYFLFRDPHALPDPLHQWFKRQITQLTHIGDVPLSISPMHLEQTGRRLVIHLIPDPIRDHYLLLLEEQTPQIFSIEALELLGLTQREAEVLFWIAKDKSNAGIAKVLDCCEGTVRKHLEHVYTKLRVQTRMGAVMTALERLGLLQA